MNTDEENLNNEEENTPEENFEDVTFEDSTEDGDVLPTKDVVKKLREDLRKTREEKAEYLTGWQRAKADYVNLQKDADERLRKGKELGREEFADSLLPVLDAFDMAMGNKEAWEKVDANWRTGIEYIHSKLISALSENGIAVINQIGVPFDPILHESVESVETNEESKDHTISNIVQSGYKIGNRVLRPARVKVSEFKKQF